MKRPTPDRPLFAGLGLLALLGTAGCGGDAPLAFQAFPIPVGYDAADMRDVDPVDHDGDGDTDLVCVTAVDFRYLESVDKRFTDATASTGLGKVAPVDALHRDGDDYILRRGEDLSRLVYSGIGTWEEQPGPVPDSAPPAGLSVEVDLDGDGRPDRARIEGASVRVEVSRGGEWIDVSAQVGADSLFLPRPGTRICAADLEGDGDIDLFVVGQRLFVMINNGGRLAGG